MYARLSQVARHLSRPRPGTSTAPRTLLGFARRSAMISADDRNSRTIHTAACLIIGDEVLNGKVCVSLSIINPHENPFVLMCLYQDR